MARDISLQRKTSETTISLKIHLHGTGESDLNTGIPFFDHMFALMSKHGFFNLQLKATGDVAVDFHHTIEDTGILLGEAVKKGVDDKKGI